MYIFWIYILDTHGEIFLFWMSVHKFWFISPNSLIDCATIFSQVVPKFVILLCWKESRLTAVNAEFSGGCCCVFVDASMTSRRTIRWMISIQAPCHLAFPPFLQILHPSFFLHQSCGFISSFPNPLSLFILYSCMLWCPQQRMGTFPREESTANSINVYLFPPNHTGDIK